LALHNNKDIGQTAFLIWENIKILKFWREKNTKIFITRDLPFSNVSHLKAIADLTFWYI